MTQPAGAAARALLQGLCDEDFVHSRVFDDAERVLRGRMVEVAATNERKYTEWAALLTQVLDARIRSNSVRIVELRSREELRVQWAQLRFAFADANLQNQFMMRAHGMLDHAARGSRVVQLKFDALGFVCEVGDPQRKRAKGWRRFLPNEFARDVYVFCVSPLLTTAALWSASQS